MTQTIAPAADSGAASEKGGVSNVTYVYITSPPHTPGSDWTPQSKTNGADGTLYGLHYNSYGTGGARFAAPGSPGTGPGGFVMQPVGSQDLMTGATYGTGGGMLYNPQTGATSSAGTAPPSQNLGYDVGGVVVPIRRVQR
jgi:hypothetical protein